MVDLDSEAYMHLTNALEGPLPSFGGPSGGPQEKASSVNNFD